MSQEKKHEKHMFLKTHKGHKGLIAILTMVLFIMGAGLFIKVNTVDVVSDANFRVLIVGLMFSIAIIPMVLVILLATFYIEIKDKFLQ